MDMRRGRILLACLLALLGCSSESPSLGEDSSIDAATDVAVDADADIRGDVALDSELAVDAVDARKDPWGPDCKPRHWSRGKNTATSAMPPKSRAEGLVTLLPDGRVLLSHAISFYDPSTDVYDYIGGHEFFQVNNTANVLADGKHVLYAGGGDFGVSNGAQIFDVDKRTIRAVADMKAPRKYPQSFLLPNGKVLVVGGDDGIGAVRPSAEIFDPVTETWSDTWKPMHHEGHQPSTQLADGSVIALFGDPTSNPHPYFYRYHPDTDVWEPLPDAPVERQDTVYSIVTLPDGRVMTDTGHHLDFYDPTTRTWSAGPDIKVHVNVFPRSNRKVIVLPCGKVFYFGFADIGSGGPVGQELFDPKTNEWLYLGGSPPWSIAEGAHAVLLPDGRILTTFGKISEEDQLKFGDRNWPMFFSE